MKQFQFEHTFSVSDILIILFFLNLLYFIIIIIIIIIITIVITILKQELFRDWESVPVFVTDRWSAGNRRATTGRQWRHWQHGTRVQRNDASLRLHGAH